MRPDLLRQTSALGNKRSPLRRPGVSKRIDERTARRPFRQRGTRGRGRLTDTLYEKLVVR